MTVPAFPPIGERLREARVRRGLTVRGLARAVEVSASLISQIETGKSSPSVSTLYAITAALDISVEDVFGDKNGDRPGLRRAAEAAAAAAPASAGVTAPAAASVTVASPAASPAATSTSNSTSTPNSAANPVANPAADSAGILAASPAALAASPAASAASAATSLFDASAQRASNGEQTTSATAQGLRMLQQKRRVGPVVSVTERETLTLDSGVTWELLGQLPDAHVEFLRITYAPGGSSSGAGVLMRHSGTEYGHVLAGQLTLTLGFETYVLNPGDSVSFDCSAPHGYANHGSEPAVGVWFVAERPH